VAIGCVIAAMIAWVAPFDLAFAAATLGSPPLRAVAIVALGLIGLAAARRIGLHIGPRRLKHPILTPLAVAAGTAVYCSAVDWLFRSELSPQYFTLMTTTPLALRIAVFALRAFNENLLYRLFLGSVLVWGLGLFWRSAAGRPAAGAYLVGFVLSQTANIWINVTAFAPLTPMHLLHDALRYIVPGLIWSWLYYRHGFQSNEIACTSVHLFFQPLVTIGLA